MLWFYYIYLTYVTEMAGSETAHVQDRGSQPASQQVEWTDWNWNEQTAQSSVGAGTCHWADVSVMVT